MMTHDLTQRRTDIDTARGILILCVVLGHVLSFEYFLTGAIKRVIYTFHIPAFFVISGILLQPQRRTFPEYLRRRAKRLLIPYVIFELAGGLLNMLLSGGAVPFSDVLWGILTIRCQIGADWFLPTLFGAEALCFLCGKFVPRKAHMLLGLFGFVLAFYLPEPYYAAAVLRRILAAYGFLSAGFLFKPLFSAKSIPGLLLSAAALLVIARCNGVADLSIRQFGNPVLYIVGGIVGAYCVLSLARQLSGKPQQLLSESGQNSLPIMGTHQHVLMIAAACAPSPYPLAGQLLLLLVIAIYEWSILRISKIFHKENL